MSPLRIAVVGAGRLGGFHAKKLAAMADVQLVAVVDPRLDAAQQLAGECHCPAVKDFVELVGQIDAAVVAAPTSLHFEITAELLNAGAHVLVEKPLCNRSEDARVLVDMARRRGRVLQVGHVERFNPAFTAAATEVRQPTYLEAIRTSPFTFRSTDIGVVLDMMIHDIDLVLALARSPVRRVEAQGLTLTGRHEDMAHAWLEFESGCVAALSASRLSHETLREMRCWSRNGFATIDFGERSVTVARPSAQLAQGEFDVERLSVEELDHQKRQFTTEHLPHETLKFDAVDAIHLELRDFIESIAARRAPRVPGTAGRDAVVVAEQILAAIAARAATPTASVAPATLHPILPPHFDLRTTTPAPPRVHG